MSLRARPSGRVGTAAGTAAGPNHPHLTVHSYSAWLISVAFHPLCYCNAFRRPFALLVFSRHGRSVYGTLNTSLSGKSRSC